MKIEWPDFQVSIGTVFDKNGAQVKLAVTYKGEVREKLMTCDEFALITGFDDVRALMATAPKKRRR